MVVYHGVIADEETGLPLVNDKEIRAIASFIAYIQTYKDGLKKKDTATIKLAQMLKED